MNISEHISESHDIYSYGGRNVTRYLQNKYCCTEGLSLCQGQSSVVDFGLILCKGSPNAEVYINYVLVHLRLQVEGLK